VRHESEDFIGVRRCECLKLKIAQQRIAHIPERFRPCTFESYEPHSPKQMKTRSVMMASPKGSFFLHGPYGNGKTHLLYAQYRVALLAGQPCHLRTTAELLDELQKAEFSKTPRTDGTGPTNMFRRCSTKSAIPDYHLFWDDAA
jgi:DNA replication protein DnaC